MSVMNKVRVGIIGCGGIAVGKHLPALAKLPQVDIVGFYDIIGEKPRRRRRISVLRMRRSMMITAGCSRSVDRCGPRMHTQ